MAMGSRAAEPGLGAAVALGTASSATRGWTSSPQHHLGGPPRQLGDRRRSLPPPRAAEGRRGGADRDADEAGDGTRDARRGGGSARSGVAPAGPDAGTDTADATAAGGAAGAEAGRKRLSAPPRAYPPPKRRRVYATRRFPPDCGRVAAPLLAGADDGSLGSATFTEPAAAPAPAPALSVGDAGSRVLKKLSAIAVVSSPVADGGHRSPDAGALRSSEPSRRSGVAAADGSLDTDSQGVAKSRGSVSSKQLVPATRLLPKPRMVSAVRLFPPGCGRVRALQPQSPKFAGKRSLSESNESFPAATGSIGPKKKVIVKNPAHLRMKVASACTMGTINTLDDLVASLLEDDGFLKALAAYERKLELKLNVSSDVPSVRCQRQYGSQNERKLELKLNVSSDVPSVRCQRQYGSQNADARSKVKIMCSRYRFICRAIVQVVEQRSLKISRIDLAAGKVIRELPGFTQHEPMIGNVPGIEVGDEFLYRVELALVGLHRPYQGGIDTFRDEKDVLVAISIVASGGYPDELSSPGELVYTGSGGKLAGKKSDENQKLERGNLALKNCIQTKTPVRVIHGFKGLDRGEGSHSRAKGSSSFTYDGLYHVVDFWREGQAGAKVFKYKLQRIPGQPELPHYSKTAGSSKTGIIS